MFRVALSHRENLKGATTPANRRELLRSGLAVATLGLAGCNALTNGGSESGITAEPTTSPTSAQESEDNSRAPAISGESWPSPNFDRWNTNFNQRATGISNSPAGPQTVSLPFDDQGGIYRAVALESTLYVSGFEGTVVEVDLEAQNAKPVVSQQVAAVEHAFEDSIILAVFESDGYPKLSSVERHSGQGEQTWSHSFEEGEWRLRSQILRAVDLLYYFASSRNSSVVECLDANTGEEVWSQDLFEAVEPHLSDQVIDDVERAIGGSFINIAIANGTVVVKVVDGVVIALNAETGEYAWHYLLQTGPFQDSVPKVAGGTLILGRGGHLRTTPEKALVGVGLDEGTERWSKDAQRAPYFASLQGDLVFTLGASAFRSDTGEVVWETDELPPWPEEDREIRSVRTLGGGSFLYHLRFPDLVGGPNVDIPADTPTVEIRGYSIDNGEQAWYTTINGTVCAPGKVVAVSDTLLLFTANDDLLVISGAQ
jgi:outer membrane protein assembly factor BamB